jgi:hypothetical protein
MMRLRFVSNNKADRIISLGAVLLGVGVCYVYYFNTPAVTDVVTSFWYRLGLF